MLTIITPLEQERAVIQRALRRKQAVDGALNYPGLELYVVGMGEANAEKSVRSMLTHPLASARSPSELPHGLLLLGFAGGVDLSLDVGVLALSSRYYHAIETDSLEPDRQMWQLAEQAVWDAQISCTHQDSLTVDRLVSTPAAKEAVHRQYQVGTVNMEDYPVAAVARDAGVPFLAVRAVLDPANQGLPPYVLALSPSFGKAALSTAVRPWRIPPLVRLAHQMRQAQDTLTRFALAYLDRSYGGDVTREESELPLAASPAASQ